MGKAGTGFLKRRRTAILYGCAFFLPVLIVAALSLSTLAKRRQAVAALIESGLWNSGEMVLNSIENELDRRSQDALRLDPLGNKPAGPQAGWHVFSFSGRTGAGSPGRSDAPESEDYLRTFQAAESREIRAKDPAGAVEIYAQAVKKAASPSGRARAMNAEGRCLRSSGRLEDALGIYQELVATYGSVENGSGHFYGITAELQAIPIWEAMNRVEEAGRRLVGIFARLRNGSWDVAPSTAAFFEAEIDRLAATVLAGGRCPSCIEEYRKLKDGTTPFLEKLGFRDLVERAILPAIGREAEADAGRRTEDIHRLVVPWKNEFYVVGWTSPAAPAGGDAAGACARGDAVLIDIIRRGRESAWTGQRLDVALVTDNGARLAKEGGGKSAELAFRSWPLPWKIRVAATGFKDLERTSRRENVLFGVLLALVIGLMVLGGVLLRRDFHREEETVRQKTEFVHNFSHELKTPLSLIRLYAETIEQNSGLPEGEKIDALKIIGRETDRLTHLINSVLDLSRLEMGRKDFRFVPLDLAELVRETVESNRYDLEKRGFTLETNLAAGLPPLNLDREALSMVLTNLLGNAVKFSVRDKRIGVRLLRKGGDAVFEVEDHGLGIGPDDLPFIFDKFYRSKDAAVAQTSGSGLGLTLVKSLVEAHGGRIEVRSRLGEGSVFSVFLPLDRAGSPESTS
jgi:signal transduction histidine kinase